MNTREGFGDVVVHVQGHVSSVEHLYAHDKIAHLSRSAPGSVLTARVRSGRMKHASSNW